jgi:SAM-dependent methyltransferase
MADQRASITPPQGSKASQSQLRSTFNEDAELYNRRRPGYPSTLFSDLSILTNLTPASQILEIGCGTGQATLPLAKLVGKIVAIELGPSLASLAQANLSSFPNVSIHCSSFEDWPLPLSEEDKFDVVLAATSWHWLDESVRVEKSADALKENGSLVVISTHHIAGGTESFFSEVQLLYERFMPGTVPGQILLAASEIPEDVAEFENSERFREVKVRRYEWEERYSTREYLDLLNTYSGHRVLERENKEEFFEGIGQLIDGKYGGMIEKRYMAQMVLATKHHLNTK